MSRRYSVTIEGKKYDVHARYNEGFIAAGGGKVLVDGEVVCSWGNSLGGLPKEVAFEIASNKASLSLECGYMNVNKRLL
ncbi:hypothetical protein ACFLTS_07240, partial [Chloroflexota bacterium]